MLRLASIIGGSLTLYVFVKGSLILFALITLVILFFRWIVNGSEPIKQMLNCDRATSKEVFRIMRSRGISWPELHELSCAAIGYFLPLYGRVLDDRPVADSGETKKAIVFAMIRGRIKAGMRKDEFIQVIAKELVHFRNDNSPLTDPTRQVDGIMF
jgi:hypothetical protein